MNFLLQAAVGAAALLFIAVSASMNALFQASLGRTPVEAGLLAAVSIGSDITKAVLPVLVVRGVMVRAWANVEAAAVMLAGVTALSLASGSGFAASTRSAVMATHEAHAEQLSQRQKELREIEASLTALNASRPAGVIEAEIATAKVDRRWVNSKSCVDITMLATRQFCTDVFKLQGELATAKELERLSAERQRLRASVETLRAQGAGADSDPQASAFAELLGVNRALPRVVLTSSIAIILEVGSVILVLLAAGPTVRDWRDPGSEPEATSLPAELPLQADRSHWRRQRDKAKSKIIEQAGAHAR